LQFFKYLCNIEIFFAFETGYQNFNFFYYIYIETNLIVMNNKEFKRFILEAAKQYLSSEEPKVTKEQVESPIEISAEQVKILAEEMKKINKKIDLRNPLISPEFFDKVKGDAVNEGKKEEKPLINEQEKSRWQNLYNYSIPKDDSR
jgi:hypothetical protein